MRLVADGLFQVQAQAVHVAAQVAQARGTGRQVFPQRRPAHQVVQPQAVGAGVERAALGVDRIAEAALRGPGAAHAAGAELAHFGVPGIRLGPRRDVDLQQRLPRQDFLAAHGGDGGGLALRRDLGDAAGVDAALEAQLRLLHVEPYAGAEAASQPGPAVDLAHLHRPVAVPAAHIAGIAGEVRAGADAARQFRRRQEAGR